MTMPFSVPGHWVADGRGQGRGVRVSAHAECGFLVLSTWKSGTCVGTVRLLPDEAAELVSGIAQGLAAFAQVSSSPTGNKAEADRLAAVEARLAVLERRDLR